MQDLSEYEQYLSKDFNAGEIANKLLIETNNIQDSEIELETSIKKLQFDIKDINFKIDNNVKNNSKNLIEEFNKIENFNNEIKIIKPSINQLNNSFKRLDNEIIKPYNECIELQFALKKVHQTNKLLRFLTFAIYLINKIEEIDKSENNLSIKPFKNLFNLTILLNEYLNYMKISNSNLKLIKLIKDYNQFSEILIKRCQNLIQIHSKNLLKFPIQEYVTNLNNISNNENNEKSLLNLLSSEILIDNKNFIPLIELIYNASSKHSINLILRNLNNTKYLPGYIKSLEKPAKLISQLEKALKLIKWVDNSDNNIEDNENGITVWNYLILHPNLSSIFYNNDLSNISLLDKYWREIALGVDSGVREVVNKGGPIVRNLKNIKIEIEKSIEFSISSSYGDSFKSDKLEYIMVINSITNFEKRK
ncbi:hypothetical protein C6P40_004180 [Pichia californica]|uniref:Conserved oligomeric Golgi complex subunit 5 N-terminal domain-containing protein n=1 Tax=Pichia californica TaxID=460514 RepID=A0A9P6WMN5_9ASCO|nr:hypothetical protein C6P42_004778 [[Candida] californica]KAG0689940.1 hypothetical protein C6P40_004180 [[Candida] californica]